MSIARSKATQLEKKMQQYLQCNLESNKVKEKNVITCVAQHWKKQKAMGRMRWGEMRKKYEKKWGE